ncbi:uncharacterized protein ARMOST_03278 [Armillaria ostoyae]|uniref:Uncharacterized protein n=1 Tax=Armillaria ostoyae TaxID=47428 RepID=A0A284QU40_ARMOS|nr:uncharacterized protein ARMOST_03278 [Armillaria ostoyae]
MGARELAPKYLGSGGKCLLNIMRRRLRTSAVREDMAATSNVHTAVSRTSASEISLSFWISLSHLVGGRFASPVPPAATSIPPPICSTTKYGLGCIITKDS